jgi:hypothetical protein
MSLNNHFQGYRLSGTESLECIVLSPYAERHLNLIQTSTSSKECFGHYFLAFTEFLPLVGLLVSLIERIVALAFGLLPSIQENGSQLSKLPVKAPLQIATVGGLKAIPRDIVSSIPHYLTISETASFAGIFKKKQQSHIWNSLAHKITGKRVPKGHNAQEIFKAHTLLRFFESVPATEKIVTLAKSLYDDITEQAEAVRKYIHGDASFSNVTSLLLENKQLSLIPPEIKYFKKLISLHLSDNVLTSLPKEIFTLTQLQYLYLNKNRLVKLPPGIENLKNLRRFNLDSNQITELPEELNLLPQSCKITAENNPLTAISK